MELTIHADFLYGRNILTPKFDIGSRIEHFFSDCFSTSYNKATNSVIAKRTHVSGRVACYTFSERSWQADPQSIEKWVTQLKAVP